MTGKDFLKKTGSLLWKGTKFAYEAATETASKMNEYDNEFETVSDDKLRKIFEKSSGAKKTVAYKHMKERNLLEDAS